MLAVNHKPKLIPGTPVGISLYSATHEPAHYHDGFMEIFYCLKGNAIIHIAYEDIALQEGDIISMDPHDIHSVRSSEDNIFVSFYFDLKHPAFDTPDLEHIFFVCERYVLRKEKQDEMQGLKHLLLTLLYFYCFPHHSISVADNFTYLSKEIMNVMLEHFHFFDYSYDNFDYSETAKKRFEQILIYSNKNYTKKLTLEVLGEHLGLSPAHLSYFFRRTSFISFSKFVNFIKIYHSEMLLLTTDKTISEISYDIGYSDPKFYYRNFKKWYHHTPFRHKQMFKTLADNAEPNREYAPAEISSELEHYISFFLATLRIPKFWYVPYIRHRNVPE